MTGSKGDLALNQNKQWAFKADHGIGISIAAYLALSAAKLGVGYFAGSEALRADGLNNATDIVASIAVLVGLRISRKPPDQNHRYGHSRAETLASLVASLIMFGAGVQILFSSIGKMRSPAIEAPDMLAAWTSLLCAVVIYAVYAFNIRLAKRVGSEALRAAAMDNRSDALVGIGAFVGIIGATIGLPWLDPVTAIAVAVMIGKTAWDIFSDAAHSLTDGFDQHELETFRTTVRETPGVRRMIDLRARTHGNSVFIDATVAVDKTLTVSESHDIAERIERRLLERHQVSRTHVHIEPYE